MPSPRGGTVSRPSESNAAFMAALAHELRNPIASLQGCAQTLARHGDGLPENTRTGMMDVIVRQTERMDWLIRGMAALGGALGKRHPERVDVQAVAADVAGSTVSACSSRRVLADERRLRLGMEALINGLSAGAETDVKLDCTQMEVTSDADDLARTERAWKLTLARRLLREEGCGLTIRKRNGGVRATVRFPETVKPRRTA